MPRIVEDITQTSFGVAYVAHDRAYTRPPSLLISCLVFLVDIAQVLRVLLQPAFGWSSATYNVARFGDVVYLVSFLISIPLVRSEWPGRESASAREIRAQILEWATFVCGGRDCSSQRSAPSHYAPSSTASS